MQELQVTIRTRKALSDEHTQKVESMTCALLRLLEIEDFEVTITKVIKKRGDPE